MASGGKWKHLAM